jgi:hypothetical protein
MNQSGLIESIFDRVLADKEKTILKIKVEDIINEKEDEDEDEIELDNIELENNLSLTCKSMDEDEYEHEHEDEGEVNEITSPNNNEPVGKDEQLIEETEEMLTPEPNSKSEKLSFIRRLCSCLYK